MLRCAQTALASILLAAGMSSIVIQNSRAEQHAGCGLPRVDVVYQDPTELGAACAALGNLLEVNPLTYQMNPEVVAVAAYKTYLANDGANFVRTILRGEFVPPRVPYPVALD